VQRLERTVQRDLKNNPAKKAFVLSPSQARALKDSLMANGVKNSTK